MLSLRLALPNAKSERRIHTHAINEMLLGGTDKGEAGKEWDDIKQGCDFKLSPHLSLIPWARELCFHTAASICHW